MYGSSSEVLDRGLEGKTLSQKTKRKGMLARKIYGSPSLLQIAAYTAAKDFRFISSAYVDD